MSNRPLLTLTALLLIATACDTSFAPEPADELAPQFATDPFEPGRIVYASRQNDNWDIYALMTNGSPPVNLTQTDTVDEWNPDLSRDGSMVTYDRNGQIWKMSVSGFAQELVYADGAAYSTDPVWSPDGSQIAFRRTEPTEDGDIWIVDEDGSNPIAEVYDVASWTQQSFPAWPEDGALGYVQGGTKSPPYIYGPDVPQELLGLAPAWSSENKLLYHKTKPGVHDNFQIYALDLNEKWPIEERVTYTAYDDTHPTWSPEGDKIAFTREVPDGGGTRREIWWMQAATYTAIAPLAGGSLEDSMDPSWGPCFPTSLRMRC